MRYEQTARCGAGRFLIVECLVPFLLATVLVFHCLSIGITSVNGVL